jgi:hypothetical protein
MMELGEKTTPREIAYWAALSRIMPLGPMREDVNAGRIAFYASHAFSGVKRNDKIAPWIPDYFPKTKSLEEDIVSDQNKMMFYTTAVGGRVKRTHRNRQRKQIV